MGREVLQGILDRSPVSDDGRSGAVLERVSLADGSWLHQAELAMESGLV